MTIAKTKPIITDQEIFDNFICRGFDKAQMVDDINRIEEILLNCTIHEVDYIEGGDNRLESLLLQLINPDGRIIMMDIGTGWEMDDPDMNCFRIKISYPNMRMKKE